MVKRVKRFVLFVLFSLVFQLIHNRVAEGTGEGEKFGIKVGIPSAEAKCCPAGTKRLDSKGNCCMSDNCY